MTEIAVYERVSSNRQEYRSQHAAIVQWLTAQGINPKGRSVRWYREKKSARTQARPIIDELSQDVASGTVRHVLFFSIDRFSREMVAGLNQLDAWARTGCRLTFVADGLDLTGWMSDVMLRCFVSMRLAWAEQERQRISQRVKASIEHRRSQGQRIGAKPDQRKRKRLQRLLNDGCSISECSRRMNVSRQSIYSMLNRMKDSRVQTANR